MGPQKAADSIAATGGSVVFQRVALLRRGAQHGCLPTCLFQTEMRRLQGVGYLCVVPSVPPPLYGVLSFPA